MEIEIQFTNEPIAGKIPPPPQSGDVGAWLEFRGVVRGEENGRTIRALEYEAYHEMAEREIRRLLQDLSARHPCRAAKVIHRVGVIPVGETAIYVGVASPHRGGAIALLAEFMDRLKQDVPIWKRRVIADGTDSVGRVTPCAPVEVRLPTSGGQGTARPTLKSLDEAISEIVSHCQPLPAVRTPLAEAFGRVLRETVRAPEDLPPVDRSTRDGYAILLNDASEIFEVVDTLHAADWKPRELKNGQAVRIATGAPLPCQNTRVVMQENVERIGDRIKILKRESTLNLRRRGEDVRAGQPLVQTGPRLNAGKLALLATVGCVQPLVSPRLRVLHFTTGDEIVPPDRTPKPGQIRDSNSILIRGLLQRFPADLEQGHLPEDFERAKSKLLECGDTSPLSSTRHVASLQSADMSAHSKFQISNADVVLISGGASVGEKDFTHSLLEWLGFDIVFSQVNVRPGRPLIFGINGGAPVLRSSTATEGGSVPASQTRRAEALRRRLVGSLAPPNKVRVGFGLPGNPLSHFVCYHLFVARALAGLTGGEPPEFMRGQLAKRLDDKPCPRETLWPARLEWNDTTPGLSLLPWASSGDITCLAAANALVRVPANCAGLDNGAKVAFLPVAAMLGGG